MSEKIKDGDGVPATEKKGASKAPAEKKKKSLDPQQQQKRKTFIFALAMLVPFSIFMWLIFAPSKGNANESGQAGINLDVPEGKGVKIADNKQKAMEQVRGDSRDKQRVRTLGDDPFGLFNPKGDENGAHAPDDPAGSEAPAAVYRPRTSSGTAKPRDASAGKIEQTQRAYADVNRLMNDFYREPAKDPKIEQMEKEIERLRAQLAGSGGNSADPLTFMERSLQLASKYFPQEQAQAQSASAPVTGKDPAVTVRRIPDHSVSALRQEFSDTTLYDMLSQERNYAFNTPVGEEREIPRNAIRACVDENQTLTGGEPVKLRLLDAVMAGNTPIPSGAVITGHARVSGQRLDIEVGSIEYGGNIIPVKMTAHDMDGQKGLFIPDSQERNALNNAAATMAGSFGSSVSFSRTAGQQVAMDLTRGLMTGGTQYLSSKLREVKVSLKANYQLLLITKE